MANIATPNLIPLLEDRDCHHMYDNYGIDRNDSASVQKYNAFLDKVQQHWANGLVYWRTGCRAGLQPGSWGTESPITPKPTS